jgi:hypothetical protein
MGPGWREQAIGHHGSQYSMFVDLGAVHDPTVIGIGHLDGDRAFIDRLVTFQGSRQTPVKLRAVEETIVVLAKVFRLTTIRIESWQGLSAVQSLQRLGLPVTLFTPTPKAHAEEWPILSQLLTERRLVLFPHAQLREELLNLLYEPGPSGIRVTDRRSGVHQDHAVAIRGVVAALISTTGETPLEQRRWINETNAAAASTLQSSPATSATFPGSGIGGADLLR